MIHVLKMTVSTWACVSTKCTTIDYDTQIQTQTQRRNVERERERERERDSQINFSIQNCWYYAIQCYKIKE